MKDLQKKMFEYCKKLKSPAKVIPFLRSDLKLKAVFPDYTFDDRRYCADVILMRIREHCMA